MDRFSFKLTDSQDSYGNRLNGPIIRGTSGCEVACHRPMIPFASGLPFRIFEERCPTRQKPRVERLEANVESLSTQVTVDIRGVGFRKIDRDGCGNERQRKRFAPHSLRPEGRRHVSAKGQVWCHTLPLALFGLRCLIKCI